MKKQLLTLSLISVLSIGASACMKETSPTDMAPGKYEKKVVSKDSAGTKTTKKVSTTVGTDVNGKKTAVVDSKTSTDPKGLMNKSSSESRTVVEGK